MMPVQSILQYYYLLLLYFSLLLDVFPVKHFAVFPDLQLITYFWIHCMEYPFWAYYLSMLLKKIYKQYNCGFW